MAYEIKRTERTELAFCINGKTVPLVGALQMEQGMVEGIDIRATFLNGSEFELYSYYLLNHEPLLSAVFNYFWCLTLNDRLLNVSEEDLTALLNTSWLYDDERERITAYLDETRAARAKKERKATRATTATYIYLMRDERTGLVKIGKSQNPQYREKTLQSDNPLIVLVHSWAGLPAEEKALHNEFAEKRVRGEWFQLSDEDIASIKDRFGV